MTDRVLRSKEVCVLLGVSHTTLWRWQRDGRFPKAIRIEGTSIYGWRESVVMSWIEAHFSDQGEA